MAASNPISEALSRITPRERLLLSVLGLLALLAAPIYAFMLAGEARSDNRQAHAALEQVKLAAEQASAGGLAGQMDQLSSEIATWSWIAPTAAAGQVAAQGNLVELAQQAGLADVKVRADPRLEEAGAVVLAPLDVTAAFSWSGLSNFVSGLQATGKGFLTDRVEVTDEEEPELRIRLRVPIAVEENAA